MKIVLYGSTPAKKNNKKITCRNNRPVMYQDSKTREWVDNNILIHGRNHEPINKKHRAVAHYMFYVPDNRKRDTDNMICSVNDLLQDLNFLAGDHWQVLKLGQSDVEIDRENPRAVVILEHYA